MRNVAPIIVRGCFCAIFAQTALASEPAPRDQAPQPAAEGTAQPRTVFYKPGYNFVPGSVPALTGFSMVDDDIRVSQRAVLGVQRVVSLSNGSQKLRVRVAVTQSSSVPLSAILADIQDDAEKSPTARFTNGASVGIAIGDQCLVDHTSTSSNIPREVLFTRANILVLITREDVTSINLKPIAQAIDAQIAALPDLTEAAVNSSYAPTINNFSAGSLNLAVAAETNLTLSATDPQGAPWTSVYAAPDGEVLSIPPPLRYKAGSKVGSQNLTVVVYNPSLLFDDQGLTFNVTP